MDRRKLQFRAFVYIQTFLGHIIIENLTACAFEPICYTPQPLIWTGLEGPLPQGCNGPAALLCAHGSGSAVQPQDKLIQHLHGAKHLFDVLRLTGASQVLGQC